MADLLRRGGHVQESLSSTEIGVFVRLGFGREGAVGSPEVDERLHRLQFIRLEHVEGRSRKDKVGEAAV